MIREWNETTINRFLKEKRGQGMGKDYKPWLQVQDIASKGRSTRIFGHTTQRVHHLLSDLQLYYFYFLEFDNDVADIREQYPLLDFHDMNIQVDEELTKKLFDKKTQVPHIFTVSFLVTRKGENGEPYYQARIIKQSHELEKSATLQRIELQRRYFEKKGIDFGIVTEKEINKQLARNIGWVLNSYDIQDYPILTSNLVHLKRDMVQCLSNKYDTFQGVFSRLERGYSLDEGLGLILFKHLIANKEISMDLTKKIYLTSSIENYQVEVVGKNGGDNRYAVGH
ncbi:heteromeric transposase endonuclease subunit TnsA [Evansella cellulosilytica]|uniref:TnsA endonuclease n=1 Tax=Evansella cellulosilytica (strain ATCC 21833 / DSM 2522 / FERM P-1141 / JCM 9156 / N-4) TaxID=649639 RepID=E6TU45_EVAC2|nr:heteromeric transposase endonuclease subunit TnsA [Evansella cellulosilytica]ADU28505.1 TnsA endonuclease [Evansella cellulosilytica DSM 2522]